MHVIYRGSPQCPCLFKLDWWYSEDRSRIDPDAVVQCDCGQVWIFRVARDGVTHSWERDTTYDVTM